ncbi:MAG: GGDEF domain-containing protein [Pelomonas sp.]|nr:GGDEF domain-containing protein [Roseateles sp.]
MLHFDPQTQFNLLMLQAIVAALLMLALPGLRASRATRSAQGASLMLALGWLLLARAPGPAERILMSLAQLAFSVALGLLWWALTQWLVKRRGRAVMIAAVLLMPLVYGLQYEDPNFRAGWAYGWLALQLLLVALAVGLPAPTSQRTALVAPVPAPRSADTNGRRWRTLVGVAALLVALMCGLCGGLALFGAAPASPFEGSPVNVAFGLACEVAMLLLLLGLILAWRGEIDSELARLAQSDGLTGLPDRRSFTERAVAMISMARRYQEPLAMMVLDIDFLKAVNTEHGDEAGDRALALFGACVSSQMRLGDLAGRIGGEEFAVLMARTDAEGPRAFDQRMRDALAQRAPAELGFELGFSAGWAKLRHGDRNIDDLQRRAETALYEAKHAGRGRLVAEPGAEL